jgi:hypothetical protein
VALRIVLALGSKAQMRRIAAGRVVTRLQDAHLVGDFGPGQRERNPMRLVQTTLYAE